MDEFLQLSPDSLLWFEEFLNMNQNNDLQPIEGVASASNANEPNQWNAETPAGPIQTMTMERGRGMRHVINERIRRGKHIQPIEGVASASNANEPNQSNAAAPAGPIENMTMEGGRGMRHVINERIRRGKHKQSYQALHKLLPPGTKSDQRSILKMAGEKIVELEKYNEELKRRNREIENILRARRNNAALERTELKVKVANPAALERAELKLKVADPSALERAELKLKVANPASGVDSMLEVLKCLKYTNSSATAIVSNFSQHEFSAVLQIETKIRAAEVEKEVQRCLFEVERKFHEQIL